MVSYKEELASLDEESFSLQYCSSRSPVQYSTRSCDLLLVPTVRYRIRKAVFNMIQHDDYVDRYDGVE